MLHFESFRSRCYPTFAEAGRKGQYLQGAPLAQLAWQM